MAFSKPENPYLQYASLMQEPVVIADIVQVFLPSSYSNKQAGQKYPKYVFNFNSVYIQIGDKNNIIVKASEAASEDTESVRQVFGDRNYAEVGSYPCRVECCDNRENTARIRIKEKNHSANGVTKELNIQAKYVQVIIPSQSEDSNDTSTAKYETAEFIFNVEDSFKVAIGDSSRLFLGPEALPGTSSSPSRYRQPSVTAADNVRRSKECRSSIDASVNRCRTPRKKPNKASSKKMKDQKKEAKIKVTDSPSDACDASNYMNIHEKCIAVAKCLHPSRDDGQWIKFEEEVKELREKFQAEPEMQILLTLEQGLAECYRFDLAKSERMIKEALRKLYSCNATLFNSLLRGRAYCYLAAVYRKAKRLGETQRYICKSESILKGTAFLLDEAFLHYEKGCYLLEFDSRLPRQTQREEAKNCFEKCNEICSRLKEEGYADFVKKDHFAKLKKIMLFLDCNSKMGRKRTISDEGLEEAKRCLDEVEHAQGRNQAMPKGEQALFLIALSDLFFRDQELSKAMEFAKKAFELAKAINFDTGPAADRLETIEQLCRKSPRLPVRKHDLTEIQFGRNGSGYTADTSASGTDSDPIELLVHSRCSKFVISGKRLV